MINEEKTREIFGYYSSEINSLKKVIAHCDSCNSDRIISKKAALKSKTCSNCQRTSLCKINAVTNRIGRKHSEETKKKIGESNSISQLKGENSPLYGIPKTKEFIEKVIENNRNRVWSDESRKKLSNSHKGKKLTDEHKRKLSEINTGINNPRYGKISKHGIGEYYENNNIKIWMRSFWEIQVAKYLDMKQYKWEYEPKSFPITYKRDDKIIKCTYSPDFFIHNLNQYWEIKGWWRDDAKDKYEAFIKQYKDLSIDLYMKEDLEKLGIILRKNKIL